VTVLEKAKEHVNGDPDNNIKLLPSLVQSLLDCGHYAAVTTIGPDEMRVIMAANAQSNDDLAVKAAKKLAEVQAKKGSKESVAMPVRSDFEPNYAELKEDGEYFEAWFFAPSPSIKQMCAAGCCLMSVQWMRATTKAGATVSVPTRTPTLVQFFM
jgi:hypothetical protein